MEYAGCLWQAGKEVRARAGSVRGQSSPGQRPLGSAARPVSASRSARPPCPPALPACPPPAPSAALLVVGCGRTIRQLPPALLGALRERGVTVEALDTVGGPPLTEALSWLCRSVCFTAQERVTQAGAARGDGSGPAVPTLRKWREHESFCTYYGGASCRLVRGTVPVGALQPAVRAERSTFFSVLAPAPAAVWRV